MNCQIFETIVNDVAREQMIEANAREEALAHSDDCEACALRLSLERRLTSNLRALAAEMKSAAASKRVEEQLLKAFRSQTSLPKQMRPANRSRYWLATAAAVVSIAFGITAMKSGLNRPVQTIEAITTDGEHSSSNTLSVAVDYANTEPLKNSAFYPSRRKQSVRRTVKRASGGNAAYVARAAPTNSIVAGHADQDEVTTQFLPLSYASPLNLQDGGQLVRVELPRSTMVSLGLPVNMERYGEKVKADVFVSADGLARAIRFVQ